MATDATEGRYLLVVPAQNPLGWEPILEFVAADDVSADSIAEDAARRAGEQVAAIRAGMRADDKQLGLTELIVSGLLCGQLTQRDRINTIASWRPANPFKPEVGKPAEFDRCQKLMQSARVAVEQAAFAESDADALDPLLEGKPESKDANHGPVPPQTVPPASEAEERDDPPPADTSRQEFRSVDWFQRATGGEIHSELLRDARRDCRLSNAEYRQPSGKSRYEYDPLAVMRVFPGKRAKVAQTLMDEGVEVKASSKANRDPGPG